MSKILISGLVNVETTVPVRKFPVDYYPIDYPFFGINTAVSGGSLAQRLKEAIERYPGAALDLQRLMMDFTLPAPSGEGKPLTASELSALKQRLAPSVFFSPELCARYFTYMQNGQVHFVLYDDAETLHRKMTLAEGLGYHTALMMYPEVIDLMEQLFPV